VTVNLNKLPLQTWLQHKTEVNSSNNMQLPSNWDSFIFFIWL